MANEASYTSTYHNRTSTELDACRNDLVDTEVEEPTLALAEGVPGRRGVALVAGDAISRLVLRVG
jgi:hypothetical protein